MNGLWAADSDGGKVNPSKPYAAAMVYERNVKSEFESDWHLIFLAVYVYDVFE